MKLLQNVYFLFDKLLIESNYVKSWEKDLEGVNSPEKKRLSSCVWKLLAYMLLVNLPATVISR